MVLNMISSCPKCGSRNISNVTSRPFRQANKHYPEHDSPQDKYIRPAQDFNYRSISQNYIRGSGKIRR
jgi:predicted  nucleic acid-binding Zn-ribbon protein